MTQNPPILKLREPVPPEPQLPSGFNPITVEHATGLLSRWAFERNAYPGWIVAPEDKRASVWIDTRKWLLHLSRDIEEWDKVDRILLFRELNWRLDVSMVPLFDVIIEQFRKTVSDLFEDLSLFRDLNASPELLKGKHIASTDIVHAWLEVAFGLLREARESYNSEYWAELDEKIEQVIVREEQYKDRYRYEQILWAMWNVEKQRAKLLLDEWQPSSVKPLATLWKAGLLAELNELGEARDLLRNALTEIRSSEQLLGQNIRLFSLEGWCTYLIVAVELATDINKGTVAKREFRGRWQELKSWDCDPWPIKDAFEAALSKPAPRVKEGISKTPEFDLGRVVVSYNLFSDTVDEYLPAFAYIRFFEQVGIPMRLKMVNIAGNELKTACLWIAPFIGFWSPALLIRANKLDALTKDNSFLSRTRVALMDKALIDRLFDWCLRIWDRETRNLGGTQAAMREKDSLLSCLAEVLSRLALRLTDEQLEKSFSRAFAIHPWTGHQGYQLSSAVRNWFARLYEKADPKVLLEWLPQLIKAPLVQNLTLPEDEWVDALECLPSLRIEKVPLESSSKSKIEEAVDWLLKRAESETGAARSRALSRLTHICEAEKLTRLQKEAFAELLWSVRNDKDLPAINWLRWSAFTSLPSPPTVDVPAILKKNILQMQPFQGGSIDIRESCVGLAFGLEPVADFILQSAQNAKPPIEIFGESGTLLWSTEEALLLYERALLWWTRAKEALSEKSTFVEIDKSKLGSILSRFIAFVVLPAIDAQDTKTWTGLMDWFVDLRAHKIYITSALPFIIAKQQRDSEPLYSEIVSDLSGNEEHAIEAAANAIRYFIALHDSGQLSLSCDSLVGILMERIAFRRKPALNSCIGRLIQIVIQFPNSIAESVLTFLTASLMPWFEKLSLAGTDLEFSEAERPLFRYQMCCLAGVLSTLYESKQEPEPEAIIAWSLASASDPLPEVKRAFEEGRALFLNLRATEKH